MAKFKVVKKIISMTDKEIIKFQLMSHCYVYNIPVNNSDLDCLTLLGMLGETDLISFCDIVTSNKIFKSAQTVRNCLVKLEKNGLLNKTGKSKKVIKLNPNMNIQCSGNIFLDYKIYTIEPDKVEGSLEAISEEA